MYPTRRQFSQQGLSKVLATLFVTFRRHASNDRRILSLLCICFIFLSLIVWRLFKLQIVNYDFYNALANGQYEVYKQIFPERGNIYLQNTTLPQDKRLLTENLFAVATNRNYWQMYTVPNEVTDPASTAEKLTSILFQNKTVFESMSQEEYDAMPVKDRDEKIRLAREEMKGNFLARLSKQNDPYEPLFRKATDEIKQQIKVLAMKGIYFVEDPYRYYPEQSWVSHVLGFVGPTEGDKIRGLYGTEYYFDSELAGEEGYLNSQQDVGGRLITISDTDFKPAVDGADIVLTVDHTLQNFICQKLNESLKRFEVDGGSVIVMQPTTGAILALCGAPDFNPNEHGKIQDIAQYNNPAIFGAYEPGSIFKPITMASALDQEKLEPETTYEDTGQVKVGGFTIKNSDLKAHGNQTMIDVLVKSLNTGVIFAVDKVGKEHFVDYVKRFGFGNTTDITLPSENAGNISSLESDGVIYSYTASFGQGITVTPLQMVTAFSAIANGGTLVKPYIVQETRYSSGYVEQNNPVQIRQVISKKAATLLSGMLVTVVDDPEGHSQRAAVPGYHIAGKTGTAQVAEKGVYVQGKTIHSFIGYGPVLDPKFAMIVRLDNPKSAKFAESTSAVLFGEIAKFILNYYSIPPDVK